MPYLAQQAFQQPCFQLSSSLRSRRYAKKQVTSWVRNRFLARHAVSPPDVYGLYASDLESRDKNVLENASVILEEMLNGENPDVKPLSRIVIQDDRHARHVCEICDNRLIMFSLPCCCAAVFCLPCVPNNCKLL